jgi:hypothetical protein
MSKYGVSKQYGHFVQVWNIDAESKEDAWNRAKTDGKLVYQSVYRNIYPISNYVTNLSDKSDNDSITREEYDEWLEEAKLLGMGDDYYSGLPFNDVK